MTKYILYVGLNDGITGEPVTDFNGACEDIVKMASIFGIDSLTFSEAVGYWKGAREVTCMVIIFADDIKPVNDLALHIKKSYNQQAILIENNNGGILV